MHFPERIRNRVGVPYLLPVALANQINIHTTRTFLFILHIHIDFGNLKYLEKKKTTMLKNKIGNF